MARARARLVAQDSQGTAIANAVFKIYNEDTASVSDLTTTGTPFSESIYAQKTGGSPISTTLIASQLGQVEFWTDTARRFDVGIDAATTVNGPQGARVFESESLEIDPGIIFTTDDTAQTTTGAKVFQRGAADDLIEPTSLGGAFRRGTIDGTQYIEAGDDGAIEGGAVNGRNFVRSGQNGYPSGGYFLGDAISPSTWEGGGANGIIGIIAIGQADCDGATIRGANIQGYCYSGRITTPSSVGVYGIEVNVGSPNGQNIGYRQGITCGAVGGPAYTIASPALDAGYVVVTKMPAPGFAKGILFQAPSFALGASEGIGFGVASTGTLIEAAGTNGNTGANATVAHGVDFSTMTFSQYAWRSPGFTVDGFGNVDFEDTALSIKGDFSNATVNSRVGFVDRGVDKSTSVHARPSGTAQLAEWVVYTNANTPTGQSGHLTGDNTSVRVMSSRPSGSGASFLPLELWTSDANRVSVETDGSVQIETNNRAILGRSSAGISRNIAVINSSDVAILSDANLGTVMIGTTVDIQRFNGTSYIKTDSTGIGFFASSPVARPTVTGSKGANAALTSLLTGLAALGLVVDSSS